MSLQSLITAMNDIAPTHLAADWDNVGLLLGSPSDPLRGPVLLTIDLTESVLDEAEKAKASAVIAYHPPIFSPLKRITDADASQRTLLRAARLGLAIYSPHTALDAAPGAMTDWLADGLLDHASTAGADRRAIVPHAAQRPTEQVKIVTFVPAEQVDAVRAGLASAGAGLIGHYQLCSFAVPGTGTFFGGPGSKPVVGKPGKLESVTDIRLEMVCSSAALALALTTLRQFHPYEEPAIDVYPLLPQPQRASGMGRRLVLDRPATLHTLADRLKKHLGLKHVAVAQADAHPITHIGVCPGAGGSLAPAARGDGCEVFITGEMKHHETLAALRSGLSLILAGHTATERGYLPHLRDRLAKLLPKVKFTVSDSDRDPLVTM